jgi:hypothetical protein
MSLLLVRSSHRYDDLAEGVAVAEVAVRLWRGGEVVEAVDPAHRLSRDRKRRIRALLRDELTAAGHGDPDFAAEQLQLLIEGVNAMAALNPGSHPARSARLLAQQVVG